MDKITAFDDIIKQMNTTSKALIRFSRGEVNRIVINKEGEAVPMSRAKALGIEPDCLYIREDGWVLGTPFRFKDIAQKMWADEWVGYYEISIGMLVMMKLELKLKT